MAWENFPVTDGQDIQGWDWLAQFWRALRERAWATGGEHFPRTTIIHDTEGRPTSYTSGGGYTGIVTGFAASGDDYVLTDSGKTWISNFIDPIANPHAPTTFDVVIEHDESDPGGVVRSSVVSNTADTITLSGGTINDAVAAAQIPSAASLVGKRYCLVRKHGTSHPSLHWHDRWLPWPNAPEFAAGSTSLPTTTTITDTAAAWKVNEHAGRELMTLAAGRLVRIPIVSNSRDTLTFAARATAPDAGVEYAVVIAGSRWAYGRTRPAPWRWYGGYDSPTSQALVDPRFYSHYPDGTIQPARTAALQISLLQPNFDNTLCVQTSVDIFDWDYWTGEEEDCTAPDRPHSPEFYYSLRGLQVEVEGIAPGFIEAKSYDDLGAVPEFVQATWLKAAGISHYTTTVSTATTSGTAHITFPAITLPAGCIEAELWDMAVHYAILDDDGTPLIYGFSYAPGTINGTFGGLAGTLPSATRINLRGPTAAESDAASYPPADVSHWVGKTLIISLGWSRYRPREFRYFYDRTVCIEDGGATTSFYLTRAKSTRYVETTELGTAGDTDAPLFVDGDAARYVGDNWSDPTTDDSVQNGQDADLVSRDRFFTGIEPHEYGRATGGSARSLQDTTRSDQFRWWTEGAIRTEAGTATGGSTTSLSDSSKAASVYWDGTTGRYVGFVVEVEIDGVWHRRPVTGHTVGTQTLSWTEPLPESADGLPYRIREPAVLNRWKDRTLRFWIGTVKHELPITHSDDDTLFFDAGAVPAAGTYYEIIEAQPGEVWKWNAASSAWVAPSGTDPRGQPWRIDKRENLPTAVRRFGRMRRGDYITRTMLNELYAGINALVWTRGSMTWTARSLANYDSGTPENNNHHTDVGLYDTSVFSCSAARADYDTFWPQFATEVEAAPRKAKGTTVTSEWALSADARYAYARCTDLPTTRINHAKAVYVLTGPPGTEDTTTPNTVEFDAQGDNVYNGRWGLLAETSPSTTQIVHVKVGTNGNPPNWGREPVEPTAPDFITDSHHLGWQTLDQAVILKWNVAGGMTYA